MINGLINILLGFLEGFALIISPCILPVLPIILAGSLEGEKKRPFGIVIGFVLTFAIFTFFSRKIVQYSGIDLSIMRNVSYALLILLGIIMLSNYLTEKFEQFTHGLANFGSKLAGSGEQKGFYSGIILGCLIGLVWTPCAGPILAAVIVQSVLQKSSTVSFFIILAFGLGAAIPMLLIALLGRRIMAKLNVFRDHAVMLRKLLGAVIIASVLYMVYGESFTASFSKSTATTTQVVALENPLASPYPAPPFAGIVVWINSPPLQLNQLKGKVVLIDFWTYSCINCIRTLPYLKDWYRKYHQEGFEIIGVHAPEFEFEKNLANIKDAVIKFGIKYPVAVDSNYVTWQNYHNQYWPAHYLIDKNGMVVYEHFGEGEYATTENNIRYLLGLHTAIPEEVGLPTFNLEETPETYLGYARMENYASPETIGYNKPVQYTFPDSLPKNAWALQGMWNVSLEKITSAANNAALQIHFNAKKVFIVMGGVSSLPMRVNLLLDGKPIVNEKGKDVIASAITVKEHRLYEAVVLNETSSHVLQLEATAPGLEVYTFTFGG